MLVCTSWGIWLVLQCSIPPLYCHDYDTNSVKWLRSVIKATQSMEDERTPSPFDLVFFNRMFSFIFSFVRKCSKLFFFLLTANVPTLIKLSLGKASWLQREGCACAESMWHMEWCDGSGHIEPHARKWIGSSKGRGDPAEQLKPWANLDFWKMGVIILWGRALIILLILCPV